MNSDERVGTSRHYPILDEGRTLNHKLFDYYNRMEATVDIKAHQGGFLVNKDIALGPPIDHEKYEKAMRGEFEGNFKNRHDFFESVDDVCFVKKQKLCSRLDEFYCGSCFDFYNHLTCHHAAIFQYQTTLPVAATKLCTTRGAIHRRIARGNSRIEKTKERRLARAKETNKEMESEKAAIKPVREIFLLHTDGGIPSSNMPIGLPLGVQGTSRES